jgi:adenylate cyclase
MSLKRENQIGGDNMKPEIEKKFLLKKFPKELMGKGKDLKLISIQKIDQTYIGISKDDEIRVRRLYDLKEKKESFTYTFKRDQGEFRLEEESEITKALYKSITGNPKLLPLHKKRTTLKMGNVLIEIDEYKEFDLIVAEVEFESLDDMHDFIPPKWFGKEITREKKYSNKTMWKQIQKKEGKKK